MNTWLTAFGVNQSAEALVTKLHVTPQPNDTSKSLQKGGDENLAALKKLSGAALRAQRSGHRTDPRYSRGNRAQPSFPRAQSAA